MPDTKVAVLSAISTIDTTLDAIPIVDVSDTTMAISGTTKKISVSQILSAGTNLVVPAGTAGAPSISFSGDSNTGIYAPAADQLSISSGGSGNATVSSTGLSVTGLVSATSTITGTQLISTLATGTAPLSINSTTLVSNLNADLLDGQHGTYYQDASNITAGTLAVTRGGTGILSYAIGDLIYASAATTLAKLASVASGSVLVSGGVATAPSWGKVELDLHVSKILPIANGGTGASTFTAGRVLFGNGTSALNTSANLFWDNANNRLGIGTATPDSLLHLEYPSTCNWKLRNSGSGVHIASYAGSSLGTIGTISNNDFYLFTNNTERIRLASDGVCTWSNVVNAGTAMLLSGDGLKIGTGSGFNSSRLVVADASPKTSGGQSITLGTATGGANDFQLIVARTSNTTGCYYFQSVEQGVGYKNLVFQPDGGNCGIGTATPSYKLDVAAAGAILANAPFSVARITGANAVANDLTLSGPNTSQVRINFGDPENSGVGEIGYNHASNLMRFVVNNGQVHTLEPSGIFTWYDGAGGTRMTLNGNGLGVGIGPASGYKISTNGNVGLQYGSELRLINTDNSSAYAIKSVGTGGGISLYFTLPGIGDRMVLDYNGNLGIGTTTPISRLHVDKNSAAVNYVTVGNINNGIQVGVKADGTPVIQNYAGVGMVFGGNGSTTPTTQMVLDSSGNVGIGTTTIPERLTVSGNVLATDSAGTYPRFISTVGAKSWEIGYRSGTTNYELREDGTTRLVVANGGNVGIGATTPLFKLDVRGGSIYVERSSNPTNGTLIQASNQTTTSNNGCKISFDSYNIGAAGAGVPSGAQALAFYVGGVADANEKARIDTAGNLGLGVTPSAGYSNVSALEIGILGSTLMSGATFGGTVYLGQNSYYNGSWRFARASAACLFGQNNDKSFAWYQSSNATPTVGGAINWTQAMTLTAGGVLLLGTASAASSETLRVYNTTNSRLIVDQASNGLVLGADASGAFFDTTGSNRLAFFVGGTQRMAIDTSGNTILAGPLRAANGTAAAPSISFDSDTNTGIYRIGADTVGISTNGVAAFKINSNGSFGYTTDVGGAVTQATSRTTGVTLNSPCGGITLVSAAGSTSWQTFTVTNSTVEATDVVRVCQKSGTDLYQIHVTNVSAGSFKVTFATTGGTTTEQPVFNFAVIKATAGNPV